MFSLEFLGTRHKKGRSVMPDDVDFVGDFIEAFKPETRFRVKISKYVLPRSKGKADENGNQLGYFFGTIVEAYRKEILFCLKKEEAYYFILNKLSYELKPGPKGKPIKHLIHVDDSMPMDKMADLITRCLMYAAQEHGIFIPDPDPRKSKRWRAKFIAEGYGNPA